MLYKGIFWIKDVDKISQSIICVMISCDKNGIIDDTNIDISALGKSGNKYNHKLYWNKFPNKITDNGINQIKIYIDGSNHYKLKSI